MLSIGYRILDLRNSNFLVWSIVSFTQVCLIIDNVSNNESFLRLSGLI